MGFYDFDKKNREAVAKAQDAAEQTVRENPFIKESEANLVAEGKTHRTPKTETLAEHRKHCKAEPGNCPFEKAFREIDTFSPEVVKVTKQMVYDRLAIAMTQLFALGADVAKSAIDDDSDAAKNVADAIEAGIEKIKSICEDNGCKISMDEAGTKYIIIPPKS
jgi:hypothetical protein